MKRVGVLGSFVWDTIWYPGRAGTGPVEQWGGIAYSLAAFSAACAPGWQVVPVVKVGADLAGEAERYLAELPNLTGESALRVVPEATNRVELRYLDAVDREERLSGGVPGWSRAELSEAVAGLDALYVNFVSGFELDLAGCAALRGSNLPLYADLHSLFLGPPGAGPRAPRRLPAWREWLACFDAVQLNAAELELLGGSERHLQVEEIPTYGPLLALVTDGARGARYAMVEGLPGRPERWSPFRAQPAGPRPLKVGHSPTGGGELQGDPTGCGDVWGSVVFASLLGGVPVERALLRAHAAAAVKIQSPESQHLASRLAVALPEPEVPPGPR